MAHEFVKPNQGFALAWENDWAFGPGAGVGPSAEQNLHQVAGR